MFNEKQSNMTYKEAQTKHDELENQINNFLQNDSRDWEEKYNCPEMEELKTQKREIKKQVDYLKVREIRDYCNMAMYSDVHPYEVVKVVSDKCVEIRAMKATLVNAPKDFHPGGFVGHYADNYAQEYTYESNPEGATMRVRWSERNRRWQQGNQKFRMSDKPVKFHDYNF